MKLSKLSILSSIAATLFGGVLAAGEPAFLPMESAAPLSYGNCDCGEPVCGCEELAPVCGCEEPVCGCEITCDSGCDSLVGGGLGLPNLGLGHFGLDSLGKCCPSDPFTLFGSYRGWNASGFVQLGYHSEDAAGRFNTRDSEVQLQQAWMWIEKVADGSCGLDIGGRIDYVYGTDGPDTQAFGDNDIDDAWDTDWRNGNDYGQAIPQAYAEVAYGDVSVKLGHFYTITGWEVVPAIDNFFYSHAYTMYNAEPFTHTGALASANVNDDITLYGGYTLGWDSGFNDNGDNFLGGVSASLFDDVTFIYTTTIGRFNESNNGGSHERGYMHSIIADVTLSQRLQYIFQTDFMKTQDQNDAYVRDSIGINQYWIYTINDCWSAGARFEWFNVDSAARPGGFGDNNDIYDLTLGVNYKPHANLLLRPEVRWDWDKDGNGLFDGTPINENGDASQTTFAIDVITTF